MKVLIIDNYDSFTFNLYQIVGEILTSSGMPFELIVQRNDKLSLDEIKNAKFDRIIISPGPGDPSDEKYFGVCGQVITEIGKTIPVLGVCLGMQGIGHYFGGKVVRAVLPKHGKTSLITHDGLGIFKDLPQSLEVMRYHSLVVEESSLPNELIISAYCNNGNGAKEIMGLRHKKYPIEGVQFHPESFATEGGKKMMENFLT